MFAVGRPGSGKSTAIRHIIELAKNKQYAATHERDYTILLKMSKQTEHCAKFCTNEHEGFDVVDFSVLNVALKELETQINDLTNTQEYDVILVEFARDSYKEAFGKFSRVMLENAYILFVEAELNVCIERVRQRAAALYGPDHHFLSKGIMTTYYKQDHLSYMKNSFEDDFKLKNHRVKTIYNDTLVEKLEAEAEEFAERIFQEVRNQRCLKAEKLETQQTTIALEDEKASQKRIVDVAVTPNQEVLAIA